MREYIDSSHILYYLYCILKDYTDEEAGHYISQTEIIKLLKEKYDVEPDRKTVKKRLDDLVDLCPITGIEIRHIPGLNGGYQMVSRQFDASEVMLLVNMVQSSESLKKKQKKQLEEKLLGLVSKEQAEKINEQNAH